tara:strand:- start:2353 stop:2661 length:309 start_codon:yes stop_codon:yes gene_type:complete
MTFDNLHFKDHGVTQRGIHATLKMGNGKVLSVVAGDGFYSLPGGTSTGVQGVSSIPKSPPPDYFNKFEVAIIDEENDKDGEFEVRGWQTRKKITQILKDNEQ